jgi:hypothetical protein
LNDLEEHVGSTVFVIDPHRGETTRLHQRHMSLRFGEPVILCRTKPLRNPGQVVSVEALQKNTVLVKERSGQFFNVDLARLSPTAPRFSAATPLDAASTLMGAFQEADSVVDRLHDDEEADRRIGDAAGGRDGTEFWRKKGRKVRAATYRAAMLVLNHMIQRRPEDMAEAQATCGGDWCTREGTLWTRASADPQLTEWYLHGIADGGLRDAYGALEVCIKKRDRCETARGFVEKPPVATGAATVGGDLTLSIKPARAAERAVVILDNRETLTRNGENWTVHFDKDGQHTISITAVGFRAASRGVRIRYGGKVFENVVLTPAGAGAFQ